MRQWLAVGWFVVFILAIVAVVSFVRGKRNDAQYQATLLQYRSALKPGATRAEVEDFLRRQRLPFERTCCEATEFFDRTKIGTRSHKFFCSDQNIYLEFKFDNGPQKAQVASGSDALTKIDLVEQGLCL